MPRYSAIINTERFIDPGRCLISQTDRYGQIIYCNDDFIAVSGYRPDELIGNAHDLLRHPDMPAGIYDELWRTIRSGNPWIGVLKNLCKNGDFYWTRTFITPLQTEGRTTGYKAFHHAPSYEDMRCADDRNWHLRHHEMPDDKVLGLDGVSLAIRQSPTGFLKRLMQRYHAAI